jgi:hypothetical protein
MVIFFIGFLEYSGDQDVFLRFMKDFFRQIGIIVG